MRKPKILYRKQKRRQKKSYLKQKKEKVGRYVKKKILCILLMLCFTLTGCGAEREESTENTDDNYCGIVVEESRLYNISVDTNYGIYSSDKVFDFLHDFVPAYSISQTGTVINIKFTKDEVAKWNEAVSSQLFNGIRTDGMNIYVSTGFDTQFTEKIADTITVLKINQQLNGGDDVVHIYLEGKDQAVMSF